MTSVAKMFSGISAAAIVSLIPLAAHAVPVTFDFAGTITAITFGTAPSGISAGTAFNGSYTFASDAADSNSASTVADYQSVGAPYGLTVDVGGNVFSSTNVLVDVSNNESGQDQYFVGSSGIFAPGHYLLNLSLTDPTQTAFADTSLPLTAPNLAAFASNVFGITEYPNGPGDALFSLRGNIGSITLRAVPEPSTVLLLTAGFLATALSRRRVSRPGERPLIPERAGER